MKKFLLAVTVLVGVMTTVSAFAQTKVGVVDADKVIYESAKGKKFLGDLDAFVKQKQGEIKAVVAEAQQVEKEYKTKLASLSEDKRAAMEKRLSDYQIQVKRMQDDAKRELSIKQKEGFEKFRKILEPIIDQLAKEKNIDIVLSKAQSGVIYSSPAVDFTADVIKKFDAQQ